MELIVAMHRSLMFVCQRMELWILHVDQWSSHGNSFHELNCLVFGTYLSNLKHKTTKIRVLSNTMSNLMCAIEVRIIC